LPLLEAVAIQSIGAAIAAVVDELVKHKRYALHAPEVECIGKGKARKPYEFGVRASSIAVTHKNGLMVGARTFPGNPYDGHTLNSQLEQIQILLEGVGVKPKQAVVDLGFRGVDGDNPDVEILHRGRWKSMTRAQRRWLKRRQAVEPAIGHLTSDHRMERCWLRGEQGDAIHAVLCAAGYNLRWLLRAIARLNIAPLLLRLLWRRLCGPDSTPGSVNFSLRRLRRDLGQPFESVGVPAG
jgi:IS5 family transposase